MSKKDQAIATALYLARAECDGNCSAGECVVAAQWDACVTALSSVFRADNPAFDHARFLEACETGKMPGDAGAAVKRPELLRRFRRPCRCRSRRDENGKRLKPDTVTCGACGFAWCDRCSPTHGPRCWNEENHREEEELPPCVRAMKCYCAGHAGEVPASEPCDTRETQAEREER